jgi:dihydrofolate synthase/folylpolyglutamate synthase
MPGILKPLLPMAECAVMTTSGHPRAAVPAELATLASQMGVEALTSPTVADAVRQVWRLAQPDDLICVTGSIFVVGDLLNHWDGLQSELRAGIVVPEDDRLPD